MAAARATEEVAPVTNDGTHSGAVLDWFTAAREPRQRPDPVVLVRTGTAVPAWTLRVLAAAALAVVGVVIADGAATLVIAALLAVVVAVVPHGPVPAIGVLAVAVYQVTHPADAETMLGTPEMVRTAVVLAGLHLMVHLCRRAGDLGPKATVELAALRAGVAPALAAQAVAQACGALAMVEVDGPAWPSLVVIGVGLVVIASTGRALHRRERAELAAERSTSHVDETWTWSRLED
ncbi:hypothetical protein IM660_05860 [Ruania alkalisoli]|uniref:Uncharacterized protein n=1 Tax=Ruania alkalisoli TaxID=2779775 RepID=A0A7M1SW29_9MICO|nr:hypothetical protein [Ruania alkalisoli]QOR71790.1 hypothetical protein IM660_05860 [Ruania alkalisoli]